MRVCLFSYRYVRSILNESDEKGAEELLTEVSRMLRFFREMTLLLEETRDTLNVQKQQAHLCDRLDALLQEHGKCRARLQAAYQTLKNEGTTAEFFEDLNECGRRLGRLLTKHFAPQPEGG